MRHTALALASLIAVYCAALPAREGPRPLPNSKEFGTRLVKEFDVPDELIEKFRKIGTTKPNPKLSALENTLFAKNQGWQAAEFLALDSTKNPYTIVVTVTGTAKDSGDITTMWTAGWTGDDGVSREQPLTGLMKNDAKAGERVTLTAGNGSTSFKNDMKLAPSISLLKAQNFALDAIHVQVWQGVSAPSGLAILSGFRGVWIAGAMFVGWWIFLRKR